jgi:hypothetical protein
VTQPADAAGWPADVAVGGISTRRDSIWRLNNPDDPLAARPRRLPLAAQRDPNKYLRQYAIAGRTADLVRDGYPPQLLAAGVAIVREDERRHPGADPVQTMHLEWQTNRSDPGREWVPSLLAAYVDEPLPREERLAREVRELREAWPAAALYFLRSAALPLEPREERLAAEALFLRLVAIAGGRYK